MEKGILKSSFFITILLNISKLLNIREYKAKKERNMNLENMINHVIIIYDLEKILNICYFLIINNFNSC